MGARKEQQQALRTIRGLLRAWARWKRRWRPHLGYPSAVPYLDEIRGSVDGYTDGDDYDERIEAATMRALDEAITRDLTANQKVAVYMRYLNEVGPAVWRSNRVPREQIRQLCDEAEIVLCQSLRCRAVVL